MDLKKFDRLDLVAVGAATLAFVLSWFSAARSVSVDAGGLDLSDSVTLWHGYGVIAALLMLVGAVILGAEVMGAVPSSVQLPVSVRWIATGVLGLSALLTLIYLFSYGGDVPDGLGVDVSPGFLGIVMLLVLLVATAASAMRALNAPAKPSSTSTMPPPPPTAPPAPPTAPPA